jgi:hypothetical protein
MRGGYRFSEKIMRQQVRSELDGAESTPLRAEKTGSIATAIPR